MGLPCESTWSGATSWTSWGVNQLAAVKTRTRLGRNGFTAPGVGSKIIRPVLPASASDFESSSGVIVILTDLPPTGAWLRTTV